MSIDELEDFFRKTELPQSVKLGPGETIVDVKTFIHGHMSLIRHAPDSLVAIPFYSRLLKLHELLSVQK